MIDVKRLRLDKIVEIEQLLWRSALPDFFRETKTSTPCSSIQQLSKEAKYVENVYWYFTISGDFFVSQRTIFAKKGF